MPAAELFDRLRDGDRSAVAEALNLIDDHRPEQLDRARALVERLCDDTIASRALRVGLTGPPGAGKSTLLDALLRVLRRRGCSVGIIAVDPSSPRSGGALLGDRLRLRAAAGDTGVFVRSMAARDRLGGLAAASGAGVEILAAAFDWVFVETVGVGQSEAEVANWVDTLVFVAQPGGGDWLQAMKAGLVELPDLFVVNKADRGPAAARSVAELRAGASGATRPDGWSPEVLPVSALDGTGVPDLIERISAHRRHLEAHAALSARRRRGRDEAVMRGLEHRYGSYGLDRLGGREGLRARLRQDTSASPFALARQLGREIEAALRGPG